MTASLSDLLTAAQNIVKALNDQSRQTLLIAGAQISTAIIDKRLVLVGPGRLCSISVGAMGGVTGGVIYDSGDAASLTNALCVVPKAEGITVANLPFVNGLLVVPANGEEITVSYSTGVIPGGR